MIQIKHLSKKYNREVVLKIRSLEIPSGESLGLVGNNGAGKTTLFSLILDLISANTGTIINNGVTVNESEEWKSFTSAFIDESFLIGYLTPEEYFYFIGDLRNQNHEEVDGFLKQFKDFFNGEILGRRKYIRDLSKGNQKKVGVVAALIGDPKVIILDEPFANLDPSTQFRLKAIFKELAATKRKTLLISSHDLSHTTDVCSRIVLLEKGEVVKDFQRSKETLKELEEFFSGGSKGEGNEERLESQNDPQNDI